MLVEIRPLKIDDAKISYKWRNNPIVWKYTEFKPDKLITEDIETKWLTEVLSRKNEKRFAILADNEYVGNIQLLDITDISANFHIFIGEPDYWGKGVATKAMQILLEYAKKINLKEINLKVNENNKSAYHLYQNFGFKYVKKDDNDLIVMVLKLS